MKRCCVHPSTTYVYLNYIYSQVAHLLKAASLIVFNTLQPAITYLKFKGTPPPQKSLNSIKHIELNKI